MATYSDYLQQPVGGLLKPVVGVWVKIVNNVTSTAYVSTAATDANGMYTVTNPLPGPYTAFYGPTAGSQTIPTGNANFNVSYVPGDDLAVRSVTDLTAGPYAPLTGLPAGAASAKVLDLGGFAYNIKNPGLGATVLDDGSDQVANINTALGNVPANTTIYWPTSTTNYGIGGTVTGVKANQTLCGAGRFGAVIKRLNTTNLKMFALETLSGVTVEDLGFDCNGANQSSNQECLRFGGNSANVTVERCNFSNVQALCLMFFGGPTVRALNSRCWNCDITPIAGTAADLLTMVSEGGSTIGVRIHSGHTAACINIYEANNHPCIGCTETLAGLGAIGIACSSVHRCPVIGATIVLGANDIGISILKETDNANARPQLDQVCSGCTITGIVTSSLAYKLTSASNTHIVGGSWDTLQQGIQYNGGAGLCGVTVGDVEILNVLDLTLGTAPPFTWWHHNVGANPFGNLAPPAIPAASVDVINNFGVGAWVQPSTASTTWSLGFQAPPILYLSTTTTGGTLVPGNYAYRVSFVDPQGGETLACTEVTIVVPAGTNTNTVTVTWYQQGAAYRAGAQSSFRVYGRTSGAELRMATALLNTNNWTDTGSVTPSGALPTVNGSARSLGTTTGPFPVPANQTIQFTGAAPAAWVWTSME